MSNISVARKHLPNGCRSGFVRAANACCPLPGQRKVRRIPVSLAHVHFPSCLPPHPNPLPWGEGVNTCYVSMGQDRGNQQTQNMKPQLDISESVRTFSLSRRTGEGRGEGGKVKAYRSTMLTICMGCAD